MFLSFFRGDGEAVDTIYNDGTLLLEECFAQVWRQPVCVRAHVRVCAGSFVCVCGVGRRRERTGEREEKDGRAHGEKEEKNKNHFYLVVPGPVAR